MTVNPVLERFDILLTLAAERQAMTLLLVPGEPPTLRTDSGLHRLDDEPVLEADWLAVLARGLVGAELNTLGGPRGVGELVRWRALPGTANARCTLAMAGGKLSLTAALVPSRIPDPERVRLPQGLLDSLGHGYGLIVCAGPVGCGKTTSALSLVEHINANYPWHIATVEDPIATLLEPARAIIQQRQVGLDVPSVLAGIRASMAQDPDVLFISDIDGVEELQGAITAAASGHLVITQLNAATAAEAVRHMVEVFPPELHAMARERLAAVLRAVSCQRLVQRATGTGFVAAYELLAVGDLQRRALHHDTLDDLLPGAEGSQTLRHDLKRLADDGVIDEALVEQAASSRMGRIRGR